MIIRPTDCEENHLINPETIDLNTQTRQLHPFRKRILISRSFNCLKRHAELNRRLSVFQISLMKVHAKGLLRFFFSCIRHVYRVPLFAEEYYNKRTAISVFFSLKRLARLRKTGDKIRIRNLHNIQSRFLKLFYEKFELSRKVKAKEKLLVSNYYNIWKELFNRSIAVKKATKRRVFTGWKKIVFKKQDHSARICKFLLAKLERNQQKVFQGLIFNLEKAKLRKFLTEKSNKNTLKSFFNFWTGKIELITRGKNCQVTRERTLTKKVFESLRIRRNMLEKQSETIKGITLRTFLHIWKTRLIVIRSLGTKRRTHFKRKILITWRKKLIKRNAAEAILEAIASAKKRLDMFFLKNAFISFRSMRSVTIPLPQMGNHEDISSRLSSIKARFGQAILGGVINSPNLPYSRFPIDHTRTFEQKINFFAKKNPENPIHQRVIYSVSPDQVYLESKDFIHPPISETRISEAHETRNLQVELDRSQINPPLTESRVSNSSETKNFEVELDKNQTNSLSESIRSEETINQDLIREKYEYLKANLSTLSLQDKARLKAEVESLIEKQSKKAGSVSL